MSRCFAVLSALFLPIPLLIAAGCSRDWHPPADKVTLKLWPAGPRTATRREKNTRSIFDEKIAGQSIITLTGVSVPTVTFYPAPADHNSRTAVMVLPGGGYRILAIDLEGTEVCAWLNSIGVNCLLLKYRVPNTGPYPVSNEAIQDAQRAMGLVREHAGEWKIDPQRLGVLGFSVGGHLSAELSARCDQRLYPNIDSADRLSCRPDFALLIYPAYLVLPNNTVNPDFAVTSSAPPTFLVQAEDDPVHVENAIEYFLALKHSGVPAELHVYPKGGHGYGLRRTEDPITLWPESAEKWLHTIGVIPGTAKHTP